MKHWFLLVDYTFQTLIGRSFSVWTSGGEDIEDLKEKVKEKRRIDLADVDAARLTVWKTKGSMVIDDSRAEILKNINLDDEDTIERLNERMQVADLGLDGQVLLVQLPDPKRVHQVITNNDEGVDAVPELKEFQRYSKTVMALGPSPSEGAKSTGYCKIQANDAQVIYDGRTAPDAPLSTIAPPIQIFHPIFDEFISSAGHLDPTTDDLKHVYDFMYSVSEVGRSEKKYSEKLLNFLRLILNADVREEQLPDESRPDGIITLQIRNTRIAHFFLEMKRELGEGSCDPSTQVSLSMRRSWIHKSREDIRQKCCCPTFLVAAGGPWLCVLGSVFTDKFIVQRLTDMRWMVLSSTEEDIRVYHNARVFVALRNCLSKLEFFYKRVDGASPFVANQPHPRYFPYPTSFTAEDGSITQFRYLKSLESDAACVTYLAEIHPDGGKVVVKFVSMYGKEVHEFLAREGCAPRLRYYGPLPEAGLSGIFPGPAQSAPQSLRLRPNVMHMVVMDYIDARLDAPHDVLAQIRTILTRLHSEGYVFGDLRQQNILFDADGTVKLIDFNWCGRYDMNTADENLPDEVQKHIEQNKKHVQGGDGSYAHYPLSMSTLEGMWAPGMFYPAPIRPIHDWMMFERLSWK